MTGLGGGELGFGLGGGLALGGVGGGRFGLGDLGGRGDFGGRDGFLGGLGGRDAGLGGLQQQGVRVSGVQGNELKALTHAGLRSSGRCFKTTRYGHAKSRANPLHDIRDMLGQAAASQQTLHLQEQHAPCALDLQKKDAIDCKGSTAGFGLNC